MPKLLLIHAHPDDETICNGITSSHYSDLGINVSLIMCTDGQQGENVRVPNLYDLTIDEDPIFRIEELQKAAGHIGISNIHRLGYMDGKLDKVDTYILAKRIANIVEKEEPDVVLTYNEYGGYGHPDHIKVFEAVMLADKLSSWSIPRIFSSVPSINAPIGIYNPNMLDRKLKAMVEYKSQLAMAGEYFFSTGNLAKENYKIVKGVCLSSDDLFHGI
jgi:LmbE family N-acetylglucosaminyl deacetylase